MFEYLLALNPLQGAIVKIPVSGEPFSQWATGLDQVPDGIIVDPARQYVYWTNMGAPTLLAHDGVPTERDLDFSAQNGSVERMALDGTGRFCLLSPGSFVTGKQLAAAWGLGRLYWSDREGAAVRSARLDGTGHREEVVVASDETSRRMMRNQCVGVAVDERNGLLYWTQKGPAKGGDGRIFRTSLQCPPGEQPARRRIEVLWSGLPEPIDLELDVDAGVIYWTDRGAPPKGNTFNTAAIPAPCAARGEITVLATGFGEAIGLAVDTDAGVAYVGDMAGDIRAVDLDGGGDRILASVGGNVTGIVGI